MRVAFDCAQQLLVVQQTSNSSATHSQDIFATLKPKEGLARSVNFADCAYPPHRFWSSPWGVPSTSVESGRNYQPRECQHLVRLDALCRGKHGAVIPFLVLVGFCDTTSRTLHEHMYKVADNYKIASGNELHHIEPSGC